jgi:hypothetical protein
MNTFSAYGKKDSMNNFRPLAKGVSKGEACRAAQDYYDTWSHEDSMSIPAGGLAGLFGEKSKVTLKRASCVSVLVVDDSTGKSVWGCSNG